MKSYVGNVRPSSYVTGWVLLSIAVAEYAMHIKATH